MEAFSLLKYWKGGGGGGAVHGGGKSGGESLPGAVVASAVTPTTPSENEEVDADNDLFDLEFAVDDDDDVVADCSDDDNEGESLDERELHFNLSESSSSAVKEKVDAGDVYFKGRLLVPPDSVSESNHESSSRSSLSSQPPVSSILNKSATKFRVFLLGFKKTKGDPPQATKNGNSGVNSNKLFTIKFKVEEVPIVSLFTRDSSKSHAQGGKKSETAAPATQPAQELTTSTEEHKRFSKYFNKVKPLYVKVSKKHSEKPRSSTGQEKETVMKVVYKHLGKNKCPSAATPADTASITVPSTASDGVISKRRDDSLLQQQDGIRGAILHCKRSFNGSRDSESSPVPTPTSDQESSSRSPSDSEGTCK